MPTTNEHNAQITPANIQEILCVELKAPDRYNDLGQAETVLPFSTTIGRPSAHPWSQNLIEWMTMTDLKISLMRFLPEKPITDRFKEFHYNAPENDQANNPQRKSEPIQHFGLSDLAVGGRCKCNGHASRCLQEDNGDINCDCQHNTEGQDCERCKLNYLDKPWDRATRHNANVCKPCRCNNHSEMCTFSMGMFKQTKGQHGGVCLACKHNTSGPTCSECAAQYSRDMSVPISHNQACKACNCHPIGSLRKIECDKHTGQCNCKDGVTGKTCDRCKTGYRQTSSSVRPCMPSNKRNRKNIENTSHMGSNMDDMANTSPACKKCNEKRKRIRFKKFCRRKAVFRATVQSKESHGALIRYELKIQEIWRMDKKAWSILPREAPSLHSYPAWINYEDVRCNCPKITLGQSYLILTRTKYHGYRGHNELLLDNRSVMLPWQKMWRRRLVKFQEQEKDGQCEKFFKKKFKIKESEKEKEKIKEKGMETEKEKDWKKEKNNQNGNKAGKLEIDGKKLIKNKINKNKLLKSQEKNLNKYSSNYGYYGSHK